MREPCVIVRGFDRPNIWLGVESFYEQKEKLEALLKSVDTIEKPGIIYAATRKRVEEVSQLLCDRGIKAAYYHAGIKAGDREQVQTDFMEDRVEVIVATTAFGMGVDQPNVRFVFHYDISDSVDSYYQEIGRAGRDGEKAVATLFYCPDDLKIRRFFSSGGMVDYEQVLQVAEAVRETDAPVEPEELQEVTKLPGCRRQYLLNYFSESLKDICNFCYNYQAGVIVEECNHPFPINSTVIHTNFGKGRVLRYEGDKIVILFETVGYKTFALELVQNLLKQLE